MIFQISAEAGEKDTIRPPAASPAGTVSVMFTDNEPKWGAAGWSTRPVLPHPRGPRMIAKRFKALPHEHFDIPMGSWMLWRDANVVFLRDWTEWIGLLGGDAGRGELLLVKHPDRDCLFDEGSLCAALRIGVPDRIEAQLNRYRVAEMPRHAGLFACTTFLRRRTPRTDEIMARWWKEIDAGSWRDQIALPYVLRAELESRPDWLVVHEQREPGHFYRLDCHARAG